MKKNTFKITIATVFSVFILASCSKQLDLLPTNDITSNQVYKDATGYKQAFAKVYASFALTGNNGPNGNGANYFLSDYYVQNASFLRMDNINFGYNVGKVFHNKANLKINANIQNAFIITNYKGLDPEVNGGIDNNFYPRPRTFVLGLNLNF